jgi:hypothetical protein
VTASVFVRDYGALIGLVGVAVTLLFNAWRADRERRRAERARAVAAVVAYLQMPYAIRRRRHEEEQASAERVRLTETFREVQAELAYAEALMHSDPDLTVRDSYSSLVATLREVAGGEAIKAWDTPPITSDAQMGLGDVHAALASVRDAQQRFEAVAAEANRPAVSRLLRP